MPGLKRSGKLTSSHANNALEASAQEAVTPEGLVVSEPQAIQETGVLKNTSEKIIPLPSSSLIEKKLAKYEKWFKLASKEQTLRSSKIPGSLEPTELKKFTQYIIESEKLYEKIRATNDIKCIAKNMNLPEDMIQRVKQHVFFNEHVLPGGKMRFPADGDMAAAWIRLQENKALASDLLLLKHELAESVLMESLSLSQREAHDIANRYYNWYRFYK